MPLIIRRAAVADAPVVLPLLHAAHGWNAAHGFNFTAATVELNEVAKRIAESELYLLFDDAEAVGTVTVFDDGGIGWLGVSPTAQGKGNGKHLLRFAEARLRELGCTVAKLDTPADHPWLPAFYQRHGYQIVGTTHWEGKRYDSVLLEKPL